MADTKPAVTLAAVCHGRDNNFNLLRFGAALAVFVSHCPTIAGLDVISLTTLLGYVAVNAFFAISGFLVVKSLNMRSNLRHFLLARALRVYPALIFAVIYTSLVIGLYFSSLGFHDYLGNEGTHEYLYKNMLQLVWPIPVDLPGVPWLKVNAPLWTLPFELHMYLLLALTSTIGLCFKARLKSTVWAAYFGAVAIATVLYLLDYAFLLDGYGLGYYRYYLRFLSMFGAGVALYMMREHIVLKTSYTIVIVLFIVIVSPVRPLFVLAAYGSLAYVLVYLAYIPSGFIRQFNKLGDYSYGIYIFGYPTQKAVMAFLPGINVIELFLISFSFTLLLSVVSWHFLEKPMLGLKRKLVSVKPQLQ